MFSKGFLPRVVKSPDCVVKSLYIYCCNCLISIFLILQAVGIALETRRIDVFEKAILESVSGVQCFL